MGPHHVILLSSPVNMLRRAPYDVRILGGLRVGAPGKSRLARLTDGEREDFFLQSSIAGAYHRAHHYTPLRIA